MYNLNFIILNINLRLERRNADKHVIEGIFDKCNDLEKYHRLLKQCPTKKVEELCNNSLIKKPLKDEILTVFNTKETLIKQLEVAVYERFVKLGRQICDISIRSGDLRDTRSVIPWVELTALTGIFQNHITKNTFIKTEELLELLNDISDFKAWLAKENILIDDKYKGLLKLKQEAEVIREHIKTVSVIFQKLNEILRELYVTPYNISGENFNKSYLPKLCEYIKCIEENIICLKTTKIKSSQFVFDLQSLEDLLEKLKLPIKSSEKQFLKERIKWLTSEINRVKGVVSFDIDPKQQPFSQYKPEVVPGKKLLSTATKFSQDTLKIERLVLVKKQIQQLLNFQKSTKNKQHLRIMLLRTLISIGEVCGLLPDSIKMKLGESLVKDIAELRSVIIHLPDCPEGRIRLEKFILHASDEMLKTILEVLNDFGSAITIIPSLKISNLNGKHSDSLKNALGYLQKNESLEVGDLPELQVICPQPAIKVFEEIEMELKGLSLKRQKKNSPQYNRILLINAFAKVVQLLDALNVEGKKILTPSLINKVRELRGLFNITPNGKIVAIKLRNFILTADEEILSYIEQFLKDVNSIAEIKIQLTHDKCLEKIIECLKEQVSTPCLEKNLESPIHAFVYYLDKIEKLPKEMSAKDMLLLEFYVGYCGQLARMLERDSNFHAYASQTLFKRIIILITLRAGLAHEIVVKGEYTKSMLKATRGDLCKLKPMLEECQHAMQLDALVKEHSRVSVDIIEEYLSLLNSVNRFKDQLGSKKRGHYKRQRGLLNDGFQLWVKELSESTLKDNPGLNPTDINRELEGLLKLVIANAKEQQVSLNEKLSDFSISYRINGDTKQTLTKLQRSPNRLAKTALLTRYNALIKKFNKIKKKIDFLVESAPTNIKHNHAVLFARANVISRNIDETIKNELRGIRDFKKLINDLFEGENSKIRTPSAKSNSREIGVPAVPELINKPSGAKRKLFS